MVGEVRERKKELRERDVVFNWRVVILLSVWQAAQSTGWRRLPTCLPVWILMGLFVLLALLLPLQASLPPFPLYLRGHPCHKSSKVYFPGSGVAPLVSICCWFPWCDCWFLLVLRCSVALLLEGCSWPSAVWPVFILPVTPSTACCITELSGQILAEFLVSP